MGKNLIEKVQKYLAAHSLLSLATVSEVGTPLARTVTYAAKEAIIYFVTNKASIKVQNILRNPNVAFTVDDAYTEDWSSIQGLQMEGRASILSDAAETQTAMGLLMSKFPQIAKLPAGQDMVVIKVEPTTGYFFDSTVSFGHRDKIVLD